jgi:hypothetical protein
MLRAAEIVVADVEELPPTGSPAFACASRQGRSGLCTTLSDNTVWRDGVTGLDFIGGGSTRVHESTIRIAPDNTLYIRALCLYQPGPIV